MTKPTTTISREGMIQLIVSHLPAEPQVLHDNLEKAVRAQFIVPYGSDRMRLAELQMILTNVQAHTDRVVHAKAGYDASTREAAQHLAGAFGTAIGAWAKDPACAEPVVIHSALPPAKPSVPRAFTGKPKISRRIKHADHTPSPVASEPEMVTASTSGSEAIPQPTIQRIAATTERLQCEAIAPRSEKEIAAAYQQAWAALEHACQPTLKFAVRTLTDLQSTRRTLQWPQERFQSLLQQAEIHARDFGVWTQVRAPLANIAALYTEFQQARHASQQQIA